MVLRDELESISTDEMFVDLFPKRGRPAEAPWRLAVVTVLQTIEHLTDRQAAEAVRARIDWKYALSLPLDDEGFDFSILSDFRQRLIDTHAETLILEPILTVSRERGWRHPLEASNALIRQRYWLQCEPSTAWKVWARACVRHSMIWRRRTKSGCSRIWYPTGSTAMSTALR